MDARYDKSARYRGRICQHKEDFNQAANHLEQDEYYHSHARFLMFHRQETERQAALTGAFVLLENLLQLLIELRVDTVWDEVLA